MYLYFAKNDTFYSTVSALVKAGALTFFVGGNSAYYVKEN